MRAVTIFPAGAVPGLAREWRSNNGPRQILMEDILKAMRALAEPTRLRILALCAQAELTVTDIMAILGQSQPRVSRHLRLLADAGILHRYREGAWAWYGLAPESESGNAAAVLLCRQLVALLDAGDDTLAADMARLETIRADRALRAQEYFAANAAQWDAIRSLHTDDGRINAALLAALDDRPVGRLLDIGTGAGGVLKLLAERAVESVGIDLSPQMLAMARTLIDQQGYRNCMVRQADMYHLPYGCGRFDTVTMNMVLHYAENPAAALAEAARVLAPGGRLLLVDFAPHGIKDLLTQHAHRWPGFTAAETGRWAAAAGLSAPLETRMQGDPLTVCLWMMSQPQAQMNQQKTDISA